MLRRRQNNRIAECCNNGWLKLILFDSKREILGMVEQGEEGRGRSNPSRPTTTSLSRRHCRVCQKVSGQRPEIAINRQQSARVRGPSSHSLPNRLNSSSVHRSSAHSSIQLSIEKNKSPSLLLPSPFTSLSSPSPAPGEGRDAVGRRQIKRVGRSPDCDGADDRGAGRRGHRHVGMVTGRNTETRKVFHDCGSHKKYST